MDEFIEKALQSGGEIMLMKIKKRLIDAKMEGMIINENIINQIMYDLSEDNSIKDLMK